MQIVTFYSMKCDKCGKEVEKVNNFFVDQDPAFTPEILEKKRNQAPAVAAKFVMGDADECECDGTIKTKQINKQYVTN
jgi:hypothetical protein